MLGYKLPESNCGWAMTKEQKEAVTKSYMDVYKKDLTGEVNDEHYPTKESKDLRIAQKHVGLAFLRYLSGADSLWALPVGRAVEQANIASLIQWNGQCQRQSISRFDGIIVFDSKTGGLCFIHFGISFGKIHHSVATYNNKYPTADAAASAPSTQLFKQVLRSAMNGLGHDEIHLQLYPDFNKVHQLDISEKPKGFQTAPVPQPAKFGADSSSRTTRMIATEAVARKERSNDYIDQYSRFDSFKVSTSFEASSQIELGIIPILPEGEHSIKIAFGQEQIDFVFLLADIFKPERLASALRPAPSSAAIMASGDHPVFGSERRKEGDAREANQQKSAAVVAQNKM